MLQTIHARGHLIDCRKPVVMGILNLTPDSFYGASRIQAEDQLLAQATRMWAEGAQILDLGGLSTRPGAKAISEQEEIDRVVPAVALLAKEMPQAVLSIDTYRAAVLRAAYQAGAHLLNDVSAGTLDPELWPTLAELRLPYVLMHLKGEPSTMQKLAHYEDVVAEVWDFLAQRLAQLQALGIEDLIVDLGFGFAKTVEHNYRLLQHLGAFTSLGYPILVGVSRKSMVWKTLGKTAEEALHGTTALHLAALERGASILRVHDVAPAVDAIKVWSALRRQL